MAKNSMCEPVDILSIRDEIIDYLNAHSYRRQEIIADLVGIRRESIWAYIKGRGLTDIGDVQKLYDWMVHDRKNEQTLTRNQVAYLVANAKKQLRESENLPPRAAKRAVSKWERKLQKYQKIEAEFKQ